MKKTEVTNEIRISPIKISKYKIRIVGDTPLVTHNWSQKAKLEMLSKMKGEKIGKEREKKNPVKEFIESLYWLTPKPEGETEEELMKAFDEAVANGARFGFKATAIKQAANSTAYRNGWVQNQMGLRGAYFIVPDVDDLVEIKGDAPVMREDPVTVGMGGTDLRYRGEFKNWYIDLNIEFNEGSTMFTIDTIVNIINAGGFGCGLGEWRVERDGTFGKFHVETVAEQE